MAKIEPVRSFFNKTDNYLHQQFGLRVRRDIVKELVGSPEGKQFLDIGCGDGSISSQFLETNKITFLDLSENMISIVRHSVPDHLANHVTYHVGPFDQIPLYGQFDYILAIGLLAHVPSVPDTLRRIHGLLNQDGRAIIQFSDYTHWLIKYNVGRGKTYGYAVNKLTLSGMRSVVDVEGFVIDRELQFAFTLPGMGKLPDGLMYRFSTAVWRNGFLAKRATDFAWLLRKKG